MDEANKWTLSFLVCSVHMLNHIQISYTIIGLFQNVSQPSKFLKRANAYIIGKNKVKFKKSSFILESFIIKNSFIIWLLSRALRVSSTFEQSFYHMYATKISSKEYSTPDSKE